jgi:hypothetical protein
VAGVFALVGFVFVAPLATVTALVISVRSALRAGRLSAKVAAWVTVLVSGALLVLWVHGTYELNHPTCISCGCRSLRSMSWINTLTRSPQRYAKSTC